MPGRLFACLLFLLAILFILTQPALLRPLLHLEAPPATATPRPTLTPTSTLDPLAALPKVTPSSAGAFSLPPVASAAPLTEATPISQLNSLPVYAATSIAPAPIVIPSPPTPAGQPPDRLVIPRLHLDAPVEAVGMTPSQELPGLVEWAVPDHRAAGWLNTSAAWSQAGNTVLAGHHNIKGEVFRDLWTLQAGDRIDLFAGERVQHYVVSEVLLLPEKGQPVAVRLAHTRYIQPTDDERLTLVTCWPYENNTHRVIVIAHPGAPE
jgi:sortase A